MVRSFFNHGSHVTAAVFNIALIAAVFVGMAASLSSIA